MKEYDIDNINTEKSLDFNKAIDPFMIARNNLEIRQGDNSLDGFFDPFSEDNSCNPLEESIEDNWFDGFETEAIEDSCNDDLEIQSENLATDKEEKLLLDLDAECRLILANSFREDLPEDIYLPLHKYLLSMRNLNNFKNDMLDLYGNTIGSVICNETQKRIKEYFVNE